MENSCRRNHVIVLLLGAVLLGHVARAQGLPPAEALKAFKPAPGFEVTLCAAEPVVRQPVNILFDQRGRMWVVQYLQYPHPAGLKALSFDQYLRTQYDRVPEPPPLGPKGADRITILQSSKRDGHYDVASDFISGLNLASSVEIGFGGVWVAQTPYLLFYPTKDLVHPDGPPQVVLKGFGMEDAHAVVNHLTWGPDGWLYGCQGSTDTAHIDGNEFQQAAWRYNPRSKAFEVFSEGGGNTFGLEWDQHGNLLTGTNYSNYTMVHYVQGGYFIKNFGKHGELHNPYAFGYLDHASHSGFAGGHVTQLGVIYQGGAFPKEYDGAWITPRLLDNRIDWNIVTSVGSTFATTTGGVFLGSTDKRFRPVDVRVGPDGALYVADWYDKRANHVIAVDDWEKDTGRIYRVAPAGLKSYDAFDLSKLSSDQLVDLLSNPNDWYARMARRILAERRDQSIIPRLRKIALAETGRLALQSLWALYVSGGFDDAFAADLLAHINPDVRAWTVRLLCDEKNVSASIQPKLVELARKDPSAFVRMQLACSARRLPAEQGLPIVRELLQRSEDATDRFIPLLLWWAMEDKAASARDQVTELFSQRQIWDAPIVRQFMLERLGRRYTAQRSEENFAACARLLNFAPTPEDAQKIIAGMEKGMAGAPLAQTPPSLRRPLDKLWAQKPHSTTLVRLALRLGSSDAQALAVELVSKPATPTADRISLIEILGQAGRVESQPTLLGLLDPAQPRQVRMAALTALQNFDDAKIASAVLERYRQMDADLRTRARGLLCGRPGWSAALLDAVEANRIPRQDVPLEQVRQILMHNDSALAARVSKLWGSVSPQTSFEKQQSIARIMRILRTGTGEAAKGKPIFQQTCAVCHRLRGGNVTIGPDLTAYDRTDLNFLVPNIVDPSASIRPEYATYTLVTKDRRVLSGPLVESSPQAVTIEDGTARITVPREQIQKLEASPLSRMPEKLLDALSEDQVRDLFAYLAGG
jgi:putative membrane-bound dehydrogenase-like protein